jgi:hypothetical protein
MTLLRHIAFVPRAFDDIAIPIHFGGDHLVRVSLIVPFSEPFGQDLPILNFNDGGEGAVKESLTGSEAEESLSVL